ncbi:MAG: hypothetical protein JWM16_6398 [Verrucomicrobiales bacterium]|nr:hypothetical protein [Verrucomicrobiales bacterium]
MIYEESPELACQFGKRLMARIHGATVANMNENGLNSDGQDSSAPSKPSRAKQPEQIVPENALVVHRPPDPSPLLANASDVLGLALAGAAAGAAVTLDIGGSKLISPNLNVAVATSGWAPPWWDSMLKPFQEAQQSQFRRYNPQTAGKAKSALENVERQLEEYKDQVYPDPNHVAYYEARIAERKAKLCRLIILENPPGPEYVMKGLKMSPDESLLTFFNGPSGSRNLFSTQAPYRQLLVAGYDQKPFLGAYLDKTSDEILVAPTQTLVCFGKASDFVRKLPDPEWSDYCSRLITLSLEGIPAESQNAMNLLAEKGAADWKSTMDRILEFRLSGQKIVVKAEPAALEAMARFQAEIQSQMGTLAEHDQAFCYRLPELAGRLSLCQYLLGDLSAGVLSLAIVESGIALARWLAEHRFVLVNALLEKEAEAYLRQEEADTLERVRLDGPIPLHHLTFKFANEYRKRVRATVMRLVAAGLVTYSKNLVALVEDVTPEDPKLLSDNNPPA